MPPPGALWQLAPHNRSLPAQEGGPGGGVIGLTPAVSLCSAVFLVTYLVLACCQGPR